MKPQYLISSLGVSLLINADSDIQWFIDIAIAKGGTINIEQLPNIQ